MGLQLLACIYRAIQHVHYQLDVRACLVMTGSLIWCSPKTLGLTETLVCWLRSGLRVSLPKLYLNYKLKSVAHLPWRQMTYKFLNTIIDDLFAFVIKMPLLHRISVFRWVHVVGPNSWGRVLLQANLWLGVRPGHAHLSCASGWLTLCKDWLPSNSPWKKQRQCRQHDYVLQLATCFQFTRHWR